jgi:hypothetical protein
MPIFNVIGFGCYRCGHEWSPRYPVHAEIKDYKLPKVCPSCKTYLWDVPREKDIYRIIDSGIFAKYNIIILKLFVKSHIKQGDEAIRILDCIYGLPADPPANVKKFLEDSYEDLR